MKKFFFQAIIFSIMAVWLVSCGQQEKNTASTAKVRLITNEEKPYVGFLIDTLKDERWYKDKENFEQKIKDNGGQVKTLAANGLDDVQIDQAKLLIEEGVDVLVVVPHDASIAAEIVELAHKAKIKVLSYDRLIKDAAVDYYISFDNEKVGELQAQEILKQTSTGNFAYIGGSESDNNAILFRKGAMNVLQPLIDQGQINLVFDQYTEEWKPEVAENNLQAALQSNNNQIDAVIAANDGTAGGAITALEKAGLSGMVPVSGQDAELKAVRRIVSGTQTMTVYKPINQLATKAADIAIEMANGKKISTDRKVPNGKIDVPSILLEPIAVDKNNIRETIIKDGYLSESEVYQ